MARPAHESGSAPVDISIDFWGKTWIYVAALILFGGLGLFALTMGPLFYFEVIKDARGRPAPDAGPWMTSMGVVCMPVAALALFNISARRKPILSIRREGLVVQLIGGSSLDWVSFVPAMFRLFWTVVSLSGFRRRTWVAHWATFSHADVSGLRGMQSLTLHGDFYGSSAGNASPVLVCNTVVYGEEMFSIGLADLAAIITGYHEDPDARAQLPSWSTESDCSEHL